MNAHTWRARGIRWRTFRAAYDALVQRTGSGVVPDDHVEVLADGTEVPLGEWADELREVIDDLDIEQFFAMPAEFFDTPGRAPAPAPAPARKPRTPSKHSRAERDSERTEFTTNLGYIERGDSRAAAFVRRQWQQALSGTMPFDDAVALTEAGLRAADGRRALDVWLDRGIDAWLIAQHTPHRNRDVINRDNGQAFMLAAWIKELAVALRVEPELVVDCAPVPLVTEALHHVLAELEDFRRDRPLTPAVVREAHAAGVSLPFWRLAALTGGHGIAGIRAAMGHELDENDHVLIEKMTAFRSWYRATDPAADFHLPRVSQFIEAKDTVTDWSFAKWRIETNAQNLNELHEAFGLDPSVSADIARAEAGLHAWMAAKYPDTPDRPFEVPDVYAASRARFTKSLKWLRDLTGTKSIEELQTAFHRDKHEWAVRGIRRYMLHKYGDADRPPAKPDLVAAGKLRWSLSVNGWKSLTGQDHMHGIHDAIGCSTLEWALNGIRVHLLIEKGDPNATFNIADLRAAIAKDRTYGFKRLHTEVGQSGLGAIQAAVAARHQQPVRIPAWAEELVPTTDRARALHHVMQQSRQRTSGGRPPLSP